MAVRLYPKSEDPSVLERLAGVPAGTSARLDAVLAAGQGDAAEAVIRADQDLQALDIAQLFGFGILRVWVGPSVIGEETDPARVAAILSGQGVDLAAYGLALSDLGGVAWS